MIFHIPCLKLWLVLCIMAFPSAYIYFAKPFIKVRDSRLLSENGSTILIYGLLLLLACLMGLQGSWGIPAKAAPQGLLLTAGFVAAVLLGFANLGIEYLEAAVPFWKKNRKFPALRPAAIYAESFHLSSAVSIVLAAGLEEMIFRQVILGGIGAGLGWDPWIAALVSAFLYGMNHVYFGRFQVVQKWSSGLVYSLLFIICGSVWPSVLCHGTQNMVLYGLSVRKTKKTAKQEGAAK